MSAWRAGPGPGRAVRDPGEVQRRLVPGRRAGHRLPRGRPGRPDAPAALGRPGVRRRRRQPPAQHDPRALRGAGGHLPRPDRGRHPAGHRLGPRPVAGHRPPPRGLPAPGGPPGGRPRPPGARRRGGGAGGALREPWALNLGYHRMPEESPAAWRNGRFHTGDMFTRDAEGNHTFFDHRRDVLRRRGENISSFESNAGWPSTRGCWSARWSGWRRASATTRCWWR